MVKQQAEALRLADIIELTIQPHHVQHKAAAELRRLHALNQDLLEALREMVSGDADAIQEAEALGVPFPDEMLTAYRRAVAAIAKATGDQQ